MLQLLTDSRNKILYSNATQFFKLIFYLGKVDFLTQNSPRLTKTACRFQVQVCEEQSFKGLETGVDWIQLWK
jgi:hypothetical protein